MPYCPEENGAARHAKLCREIYYIATDTTSITKIKVIIDTRKKAYV